jgi:hypothetical protein
MTAAKKDRFVNARGENIHRLPDGRECIDPLHSPFRAKLAARIDDHKEAHACLVDKKHERIAARKARQQRKGWPADKSPV